MKFTDFLSYKLAAKRESSFEIENKRKAIKIPQLPLVNDLFETEKVKLRSLPNKLNSYINRTLLRSVLFLSLCLVSKAKCFVRPWNYSVTVYSSLFILSLSCRKMEYGTL
jgi:hypothetical protein